MSLDRYRMFAGYNRWANARLYEAAARLGDAQYRMDGGAFFGSVHGTLNHLLVTDRIWLGRFTGHEKAGLALNAILFEAFADLRAARETEDARILAFADALTEDAAAARIFYVNSAGERFSQPLHTALDHLFNHQTHHRGQVHALLTSLLGRTGAPSLDLIAYQRADGVDGVTRD